MTLADQDFQPAASSSAVPLIAMAVALLSMLVMCLIGWGRAGGFEYPLDDPYIHLSIARQIAQGGYGINPGEFASAGSSALFPLLLVPFVYTPLADWSPLIWGGVGVALAGLAWGLLLGRMGLRAVDRVLLAVLGPLGLNLAGVGWLGMENILHTAAALWALLGFVAFLGTDRVGAILWVAVPLMTALRLEGAAFGVFIAVAVALRGNLRAGLALGGLAVAPAVLFAAVLVAMGLEPLPSSVLVKASEGSQMFGPPIHGVLGRFFDNLQNPAAILVAAAVFFLCLRTAQSVQHRSWNTAALAAVLIAAGLAHLMLAKFGWMQRYENYLVAILVAGLGLVAVENAAPRTRKVMVIVPLLLIAALWLPISWGPYLANPGQIAHQQAQMARFQRDFAQVPVAVNDLGKVSWQSPAYVLDVWGLASAEARKLRSAGDGADWMGPLAARHGVQLAMIYKSWFPQVGKNWVLLGTLRTKAGPAASVVDNDVAFYATDPAAADTLRAALRRFAPTLPAQVTFHFAEGAG